VSEKQPPPETEGVEEAERLFRYFVESVTEYALFTVTTSGVVASWNVGAHRTFGYTAADIIGKPFDTLFAPDDVAREQPATELALARQEGRVERDCWHMRADGSRFWATNTVQPLRNDMGTVIGFSNIVRDSTERYVAHAALRQSDERFRLLVENVSDYAILFLSPRGSVTDWNSGAENMFGYSADEVLDTPVSRLSRPPLVERGSTPRDSQSDSRGPTSGEQWHFRKDGTSFFATNRVFSLERINGVARGFVMIVHDITHRKYEEEALRRRAFYDELTGLPNRALFLERCARARSQSSGDKGFAVLFVDLDNFKALNDKHGHAIGDLLLTKVSGELERSIRPGDFVARLSGDEFAILLDGIGAQEAATRVAERARRAIAKEYVIAGASIEITASVGIARGSHHDRPERVLRDADFAMYEAKRRGRNQCAAFDNVIGAPSPSLRRLERELREGIERQEFFLTYQPIVELNTMRVVGFESLVRWQHPRRGIVPAGDFVPLAENSGLIVPIDRWVFATAAAQLYSWQRRLRHECPTVSVNFSTMGLARPDTLAVLREEVRRSHIAPSAMKIEITETVLMETSEHVVATLAGLRELGVEFHLDDFGTGYSGLNYLRRCGATTLKIDRSFVSGVTNNEGNAELVRAIISLAHTLRLRTIAEGVETDGELAMLRDANCDFAQGYLFQPPLAVEAATALIEAQILERSRYGRLVSASSRGS